MKKSSVVLFIFSGLFLICSFTFLPDGIGEFVCGVLIAAALAFFGYRQQKKPKDAPAGSPTTETEAAPEIPYEFIKTKIAGVTFKDGRKSRQTILRRLYWKDEPFDKEEAEVILDREEFEGKPAFAVLLNGEKAGYVPAEHVQFIIDNFVRCDGVVNIKAYCGKEDIYGAEITIRFRKN